MHPIAHQAAHPHPKRPSHLSSTRLCQGHTIHTKVVISTASSTSSTLTEKASRRTEATPASSTLSTPTSIASSSLPDTVIAAQQQTSSLPPSSPSPAPSRSRKGPHQRPTHVISCKAAPPVNPSSSRQGCQAVYATLSDIVGYSPKGLTQNAVALAEKFKLTIEKSWRSAMPIFDPTLRLRPKEGWLMGRNRTTDSLCIIATLEELCKTVPNLVVFGH